MKYLTLLIGRWRLKFGFCPMCDSSPPKEDCAVCFGDYQYGHMANKTKRKEWWRRFKEFYK